MIFRFCWPDAVRSSLAAALLAVAAAAPAQTTPDAAAAKPTFNVTTLIGDAVDNADTPQYKAVSDAIDAFKRRDLEGARKALERAKTDQRRLPPVEIMMAKMLVAANLPAANVRAELEQAVRKNPNDPEAYLMFADGLAYERQVTAAEALYQKAEKLVEAFNENPKRRLAFQKRVLSGSALVAESRSQWDAAEKLLRAWIQLDSTNTVPHLRLGRVLFQLGKGKEALAAFETARKIDPKSAPVPEVAIGQLYEQAAQEAGSDADKAKNYHNIAKQSFDIATRRTPPDLTAHLAAATWALQSNEMNLAQSYADAALKADPKSTDAMLTRAIVARFSNDLKTAEDFLTRAFTQAPGSFSVANQFALVLADSDSSDKRERARQLAENSYQLHSKTQFAPEAVATLGWVYYRLGRLGDAEKVLAAIVNANALSPDAAYYVSRVLFDRAKYADAQLILQQALRVSAPFANRVRATELLADIRKKVESTDGKGKDDSGTERETPAKTGKGK